MALIVVSMISAACAAEPLPAAPVVAIVTQVVNQVELGLAVAGTPAPAIAGSAMPSGATVTTGPQSEATINFGGTSAVKLHEQSAVTLLRIVQLGTGATVHVQLSQGSVLAKAPAEWLLIETTLGQVSLPGAAAHVAYYPGTFDPQDDVLVVQCLAGGCEVRGRLGGRTLGPGDQLVVSDGGMALLQSELSDAEVAALLGDEADSILSAATLTAWPNGVVQPTATATSTLTPLPAATSTRYRTPDSPPPTSTATFPPAPTGTSSATSLPPSATNTRRPPVTLTPTFSPTPAPSMTLPPIASPTTPAEPPPPVPTTALPPTAVAPSTTPSATTEPTSTATDTQLPPTKTPEPPPTKTPGP